MQPDLWKLFRGDHVLSTMHTMPDHGEPAIYIGEYYYALLPHQKAHQFPVRFYIMLESPSPQRAGDWSKLLQSEKVPDTWTIFITMAGIPGNVMLTWSAADGYKIRMPYDHAANTTATGRTGNEVDKALPKKFPTCRAAVLGVIDKLEEAA